MQSKCYVKFNTVKWSNKYWGYTERKMDCGVKKYMLVINLVSLDNNCLAKKHIYGYGYKHEYGMSNLLTQGDMTIKRGCLSTKKLFEPL